MRSICLSKTPQFEVVICSECLEHLEDDVAALREIERVLKKGGLAVITVPYLWKPDPKAGHVREYDEHNFAYLVHKTQLRLDKLLFIGNRAGWVWTRPKYLLYALWLLFTRRLVKRLRGGDVPSYYATGLHRKIIMPLMDRILLNLNDVSPTSGKGVFRADNMIARLIKREGRCF